MRTTQHQYLAEERNRRRRAGVTLIELLVVITILLTITAAAIPSIVTSMRGRQVRETARQVSAFLAGARARAIETGRPVGVAFPKMPGQAYNNFGGTPLISMNLYYVEVPPPYSGELTNAQCTATVQTKATATVPGKLTFTFAPSSINLALLNPNGGDYIKLNYQGLTYQIAGFTPNLASPSFSAPYFFGQAAAIENAPAGLTACYQIFRQPIKSSAAPLQLPEGAAIDLWAVGTASYTPFENLVGGDTMILFSSTGALAFLYDGPNQMPADNMYLLIGNTDGWAGVPGSNYDKNVWDQDNFWICVGYQTGEITTAENAGPKDPSGVGAENLSFARALVKTAQGIGGR